MNTKGDFMYCSFFGHRDYGNDSEYCLLSVIERLIFTANVDVFYVGNKGAFDRAVHRALKILKRKYPYMKVYIVLDCVDLFADNKLNEDEKEYLEELKDFEFLVPEGIENVPKRYAMSYRNEWMINECDISVVYCLYSGTCTQKHVEKLKRIGKTVVNIAELTAVSDYPF